MSKLKKRGRISATKPEKAKSGLGNKKDKLLIKKLVKLVLIAVAIMGVLFAGMSFLYSAQEAEKRDKQKLEDELRDVQSKKNTLTSQIENLGAAAQIFSDLAQTRSNMEFLADPLAIRPILTALKAKYHITTLNVEFKTREALPVKNLKSDGLEGSRYEVVMKVASMSDHFIYQFINELSDQVPGFMHVNNLEIKRIQPMSIEVLSKISRGIKVETIEAKLEFYWYGFSAKVTDGAEDDT